MARYIVVHPGSAHLDEILAAGLICREHGVMAVFRRVPTDVELDDANVWVVDVGMRHEPDLRNFDHHQLDSDVEPECAMSLVARHFRLHDVLSVRPWYPAQVMIDIIGANKFARTLGMNQGIPASLLSPMEIAVLRLWGDSGEGRVDDHVVQVVTRLTEAIVDEALAFEPDLKTCRPITTVRLIAGIPVIFHDGPASDSVSNFLRDEWQEANSGIIAASVSSDPRPPYGVALYRFHDDVRIDLSGLGGDERIEFAHKRGFVAKSKGPLDVREVEDLIRKALT